MYQTTKRHHPQLSNALTRKLLEASVVHTFIIQTVFLKTIIFLEDISFKSNYNIDKIDTDQNSLFAEIGISRVRSDLQSGDCSN